MDARVVRNARRNSLRRGVGDGNGDLAGLGDQRIDPAVGIGSVGQEPGSGADGGVAGEGDFAFNGENVDGEAE